MKTSTIRLMTVLLGACLVHGIAFSTESVIDSMAAGQTGKIAFKSVDRKTTPAQLNLGKFQLTDTITGDLILPDGAGPFPVMVIAHGSGGVNKRDYTWADFFKAKGIGSFIIDTYKGRGITDTIADQSQLSTAATAADHLVALRLLSTHPKVDPNRIGIMGFSRGGYASVGTAFDVWRKNVAGTSKYAVHMPFYGGCSWVAVHWDGSPIHQFIGDADDYAHSVSTCEAQKRFFDKAGIKNSVNVYAGGHHGFDNLEAQKDIYLARAQNTHKCSYIWDVESQTVYAPESSDQTRPVSELANILEKCRSTGSTVGPNKKASDDAHARVAQILEETILKR